MVSADNTRNLSEVNDDMTQQGEEAQIWLYCYVHHANFFIKNAFVCFGQHGVLVVRTEKLV